MKFNAIIASDLHSDFNHPRFDWPNAGLGNFDVCIIAGDTANSIGNLLKVVRKAAKQYHQVYIVDGNHEHYNNVKQERSIDEVIASIRKQLPSNAKLLGLGEPYQVYMNQVFIGCNGWYTSDYVGDASENHELWMNYMNDYRCSFQGNHEKLWPFQLAKMHADYVEEQIEAALDIGAHPIVITHTAPSRHCVRMKPWDVQWTIANGFYFNSHMGKLLEKYGEKIKFWVHGHVHDRHEREIDGVRIICNPRGYPGELPPWEPLVVEIGEIENESIS